MVNNNLKYTSEALLNKYTANTGAAPATSSYENDFHPSREVEQILKKYERKEGMSTYGIQQPTSVYQTTVTNSYIPTTSHASGNFYLHQRGLDSASSARNPLYGEQTQTLAAAGGHVSYTLSGVQQQQQQQ